MSNHLVNIAPAGPLPERPSQPPPLTPAGPLVSPATWSIVCKDSIMAANCRPNLAAWHLETYYWQRSATVRMCIAEWSQLHPSLPPPRRLQVNIMRMYKRRFEITEHFSDKSFEMRLVPGEGAVWEAPLPTDAFRFGFYWKHRRAHAVYAMMSVIHDQAYWSPGVFVEGSGMICRTKST